MDIKKIISSPQVYDTIQTIVGEKLFRKYLVEKIFKIQDGYKILDIACGTGGYCKYLLNYNIKYYGFDGNASYINYAKIKFRKNKNFFFYNEMIKDFNMLNEIEFDLIIVMGLLHHLSDTEVIYLLNLTKNLLKKGGRVITFDQCKYKNMNYIEDFLVKNDRGKYMRDLSEYKSLISNIYNDVITHELINIGYLPVRSVSFELYNH